MVSDATKLVLDPSLSFATVNERLEALGCEARPSTMATDPIVPGEPELAQWRHAHRDSLITYTFNPAVNLRVLAISGGDAVELREVFANELEILGPRRVKMLLSSSRGREALLGLYAVRELEAVGLLDRVEKLKVHDEPTVARAAQDIFERLALSLARRGAEQLDRERARHPDRSVLFPRIGDARSRRQMLRWLLFDRAGGENLTSILRAGLEDDDWEVRVTAMLVAARMGINELWREIKRIELPRTGRHGPNAGDRAILKALRKAALEHLAGDAMPAGPDPGSSVDLRLAAAMRFHFRRLVSTGSGLCIDSAATLVHALTTPLEETTPPRLEAMPEISVEEDGYRLAKSGIELRWVPAVEHLIGGADDEPGENRMYRRWRPPTGFFIARFPVASDLCREVLAAESLSAVGNNGELELRDARELCKRLSDLEHVEISIPTPDQWEIAARGPDGRRYPWGNGMEADPQTAFSPWGVGNLFEVGEWAVDRDRSWVVGEDRKLRLAVRSEVRADKAQRSAGVRPAVSIR